MKTLNEVLEFLDEIPAINSGGCGISAYSVYLWLKKNNSLSEDFAIIYLHNWDMKDLMTNRKFVENKGKKAVACSHAIFRYDGVYYDSTGVSSRYVGEDNSVVIPTEHVDRFMKASLMSNDWNPMFRRDIFLPVIEDNLGVELGLTEELVTA